MGKSPHNENFIQKGTQKRDPESLLEFFRIYGYLQNNFIFVFIKSWVAIQEYIYSVFVGQGFKMSNNWFYTIHKIVAMVRKVLAVQKVVCGIFNFQSALQEHKQLWKLWRNLCSLRGQRPKWWRVTNFKSIGSKI